MADSIFTTQVPVIADANDATAYTLGTKWSANVAGEITHGRWYFPGTAPSGPVDWVLYDDVSQAELGRATFTSTAPGWQTVALATPVSYPTPGVEWIAAVETPDRYVATVNFFTTSGNVVSGALTAPADAHNGRLGVGSVYPAGTFNDSCYFADLVFAPAGTPHQGAADIGVDLAIAATGARVSAGDAAAALALDLSAVGHRAAAGDAPISVILSVTATGSGGRALAHRVNAGTVQRPDAGTVLRPNLGMVARP